MCTSSMNLALFAMSTEPCSFFGGPQHLEKAPGLSVARIMIDCEPRPVRQPPEQWRELCGDSELGSVVGELLVY